jgi:hypothetical protein
LVLVACSSAPQKADLVGEWEGKMTDKELGEFTVMTLKLTGDGRFEMASMAGMIYGDWSLAGKTLSLKMTGLDDGYGKGIKDDPQWRAASHPMEIHVESSNQLAYETEMDGTSMTVTFARK